MGSPEVPHRMSTPTRFELARAEPIGFQNQLLNHSDTVSVVGAKQGPAASRLGNMIPRVVETVPAIQNLISIGFDDTLCRGDPHFRL